MSRPTPRQKHAFSSGRWLGIGLVLLSAVGLASQNVISRLFFVPSDLFGQVTVGGWLSAQLSNIVMLLALRMALMALLLAIASPRLYPHTLVAIQQLGKRPSRLGYVLGSGLCLFIGLTSLYFALSQVVAGVAIAAFFIYPAVTLLLAWGCLGQRPRFYKLALMPVIFLGVALTTLGATTTGTASANPTLGIWGGLLAGVSFGIYGIFAERVLQCAPRTPALSGPMHPVPFSLVTFLIVSVLSGVSLTLMPPVVVAATAWTPLLQVSLFSALITVTAYVLNNFGIRLIGSALTALISASTPALTSLFAWFALQESLRPPQVLGVLLVTIGIATLSLKAGQKS